MTASHGSEASGRPTLIFTSEGIRFPPGHRGNQLLAFGSKYVISRLLTFLINGTQVSCPSAVSESSWGLRKTPRSSRSLLSFAGCKRNTTVKDRKSTRLNSSHVEI